VGGPSQFLLDNLDLFSALPQGLPVVDLACGEGENGLYLAQQGLKVILMDRSQEALARAAKKAEAFRIDVEIRQLDLERQDINPFGNELYAGMVVFRYLHRPLIPSIKNSIAEGGILLYETFTVEQARLGRPKNPDFLLRPGELKAWFEDWQIIHYSEGIVENPARAVARLACRRSPREEPSFKLSGQAQVSCP
jgi:SAM-dependent methyltransferase